MLPSEAGWGDLLNKGSDSVQQGLVATGVDTDMQILMAEHEA